MGYSFCNVSTKKKEKVITYVFSRVTYYDDYVLATFRVHIPFLLSLSAMLHVSMLVQSPNDAVGIKPDRKLKR